jgi:hypothetical protein
MRQHPLHSKFIQLVMTDSLWVAYTGFLLKWNLWREMKIYAFYPNSSAGKVILQAQKEWFMERRLIRSAPLVYADVWSQYEPRRLPLIFV